MLFRLRQSLLILALVLIALLSIVRAAPPFPKPGDKTDLTTPNTPDSGHIATAKDEDPPSSDGAEKFGAGWGDETPLNETDNEVQDSAGSKDDLDDADENSANKDGLEDHLDIGLGDSDSLDGSEKDTLDEPLNDNDDIGAALDVDPEADLFDNDDENSEHENSSSADPEEVNDQDGGADAEVDYVDDTNIGELNADETKAKVEKPDADIKDAETTKEDASEKIDSSKGSADAEDEIKYPTDNLDDEDVTGAADDFDSADDTIEAGNVDNNGDIDTEDDIEDSGITTGDDNDDVFGDDGEEDFTNPETADDEEGLGFGGTDSENVKFGSEDGDEGTSTNDGDPEDIEDGETQEDNANTESSSQDDFGFKDSETTTTDADVPDEDATPVTGHGGMNDSEGHAINDETSTDGVEVTSGHTKTDGISDEDSFGKDLANDNDEPEVGAGASSSDEDSSSDSKDQGIKDDLDDAAPSKGDPVNNNDIMDEEGSVPTKFPGDHKPHSGSEKEYAADVPPVPNDIDSTGFVTTHPTTTTSNGSVKYQGALLIAGIGIVGLFVVKRSRDTIVQGVQKLSGGQSSHGNYSHLPVIPTDGDTSNHNLSNTTSEWAVDMSPAIDEAPESKPATRAMKLAGAPKKTKPNSIPLKTVNERKSQEWSDWKEDEEDW